MCSLTLIGEYFWPYFWVSVLGGLIGIVELVSRYRDDPARAITQFPAIMYIAFNVGASILALYLILQIKPDWLIGENGDLTKVTPARWILIIFVAGTAALAFFRSSIFRAKIDDVSVPVGPALILDSLLGVLDRAVDRSIAKPRSEAIKRIMEEVDFDKAQEALSSYCIALMQNLPDDESRRLANRLNEVRTSTMPKDIKVLTLGLALLNTFGEDVLDKAREALKDQIKRVGPLKDQPVGRLSALAEKLDYAKTLRNLPAYCLTLASVTKEVQDKLVSDVKAVDDSALTEKTKLLTLCLLLSKSLGMEILELGINHLGSDVTRSVPNANPPAEGEETG
jgi:hypothetical protein